MTIHAKADQKVLVTGGAGYIGSHTVLELLKRKIPVVVVDNLSNSSTESLKRVELLANNGMKPIFYEADIKDRSVMDAICSTHSFSHCIHFAGLKAVGESNDLPLKYYENNVVGTINLLQVLNAHNCKNIVFSSSATVYGLPQYLPLDEKHPLSCTNPYGRTKLFVEEILRDFHNADRNKEWNIVILRYFNPTGAHESGFIGEDPSGPPNNLMPYVAQTAIGKREFLNVFGNDYNTPDGTGVRDFIHVVDLALAHVAAIDKINHDRPGCVVYNLGTGTGYSVLEMVKAFEKASGAKVPYKIADRRAGDVGACFADPSFSNRELNWKATRGLDQMCQDLWRWQSMNRNGYAPALKLIETQGTTSTKNAKNLEMMSSFGAIKELGGGM